MAAEFDNSVVGFDPAQVFYAGGAHYTDEMWFEARYVQTSAEPVRAGQVRAQAYFELRYQ